MRLTDGADVLTLEPATWDVPEGTPADEDLLLNLTVSVRGYTAADQHWVVRRDWDSFVKELRQLELTRRGEAVVRGASPEEFSLRFYATDLAGHPAVAGYSARSYGRDELTRGPRLEFSLNVSGEDLAAIVRTLAAFKGVR